MEKKFNTHYIDKKPSFIREILKVIQKEKIISFAGGLPQESLFPTKEFQKIFQKLSTTLSSKDLQYGETQGDTRLREILKDEEILITDGSQQALDLIGKVFIDKKDKILIESPSYLGATEVFRFFGGELEPIPLKKDGLDTEILEKKLQKDSYKFLYLIPDFQNPTGIRYSLKNRKKIADLSKRYNLLIIEDAPYKDLYFTKPLPSIRTLAPNNTITLRSLSKVLSPALRVGSIEAKKELLEKLIIAKQYSILHTNTLTQLVAYNFLKKYSLTKHIKRVKKSYKKKALFMYEILKKEFQEEIIVEKPKGGMFIWCNFVKEIDTDRLFELSIKQGVAFVPSRHFYEDRRADSIRLNFTNSSKKEIQKGVEILKKSYTMLIDD